MENIYMKGRAEVRKKIRTAVHFLRLFITPEPVVRQCRLSYIGAANDGAPLIDGNIVNLLRKRAEFLARDVGSRPPLLLLSATYALLLTIFIYC